MSALVARGVAKRFGATVALAGVDLEVRAGEVHALLGETGAGKTTLLRVLSGAVAADGGSMTLGGEPYAPRSPAEARERGVATIHQELSLAPHLDAAENLELVRPRRDPRAILERLGRGDLPLDVPVGRLAPADRQRVEIARALAVESRLLVLDEPTSRLGREDAERLLAILRDLRAGGLAILLVSHALEEVLAVADRCTVLRDGRSVHAGPIAGADAAQLAERIVGRAVARGRRTERAPDEVLLRIDELELHRGEVLGIAGLVGSGRTELLRAIFGLDAVRRGEIVVKGRVGPATPRARWAQRVGFLSEDRLGEGLAPSLSVAENLALAGTSRLALPATLDRAARPWIDRFQVRCRSPRELVATLSGGNQQKVALARLLEADCDVLLLDEPTRGIDVGARAEILAAIDELARSCAVLVVSSQLGELLELCDRVAVMRRGRLSPARPARELDEHDLWGAA